MDHIQDSVLGTIRFKKNGRIKRLIDLPVMQRTRHLAQLGAADLVFPTGNHTRFSHSLGVYELTRRMIDQVGITTDDAQIAETVQVAALLHDVGHFPLSHTCEAAYPLKPPTGGDIGWGEPEELTRPAPDSDAIGSHLLQFSAEAGGLKKGFHHEALGAEVVCSGKWGMPAELGELSAADVGSIITGSFVHETYGKALSGIVKSQFDADRLDYLLRDAKTIGSTYGAVEADRLISKLKRYTWGKKQYVAFDEDAVPALDHFMMSRYFAYEAIIFHRAACCFDVLARALYMALMHYCAELPQNAEQLGALARDEFDGLGLLEWNDHLYWQRLQVLAKRPDLDEVTKAILSWVFERKQPKVVREERVGFGIINEEADEELKAYSARRDAVKAALPQAIADANADPRLCFFHESSKPVYDEPVLNWKPSDGLPDTDSVLVRCRGQKVAGPLEAVPHSLLRQASRLNFRYFRVYAPWDTGPAVKTNLIAALGE